jgi:hypothetical protein
MIDRQCGFSDLLKSELSIEWTRSYEQLVEFFQTVGLKGDEGSQSLYINPIKTPDLQAYVSKIPLLSKAYFRHRPTKARWVYPTSTPFSESNRGLRFRLPALPFRFRFHYRQ